MSYSQFVWTAANALLRFLQHLTFKLNKSTLSSNGVAQVGGRGAIVLNGSPLFTGGAGSGESNIRKWVLDYDYLEAIIGLPTDMFYNTGISTYIWVLNKQKKAERRGKVQLIDATNMFEKMRKSVGSKRKRLSEEQIAEITRLYAAFDAADDKRSKVFDREEFMYRTITVERPLRLNWGFTAEQGADSGKYLVDKGQVIFSKIRPTLLKSTIAPEDCLCSADMYEMSANPEYLANEFLMWFFLSKPFETYARLNSDRVAIPKLNRETFSAIPI